MSALPPESGMDPNVGSLPGLANIRQEPEQPFPYVSDRALQHASSESAFVRRILQTFVLLPKYLDRPQNFLRLDTKNSSIVFS